MRQGEKSETGLRSLTRNGNIKAKEARKTQESARMARRQFASHYDSRRKYKVLHRASSSKLPQTEWFGKCLVELDQNVIR